MKRNWLFTLFIALSFCAIGFTGCNGDDDEDDGTGGGNTPTLEVGDFVVTTAGAEWKATNVNATKDPNNRFTLSATKGTESITLRANDIVTGTYPLVIENANNAGLNGFAVYTPDPSTQNYCTFNSGQLVISEVDASAKTISGTFNFNCAYQDATTGAFTDGEFYKITYNE